MEIIYKNMSMKKDNSKNLKLSDLLPKEVVSESEKAFAIEDGESLGMSYNSTLDSAQENFVAKKKWIAKKILVEREVEGQTVKIIPFWVYK